MTNKEVNEYGKKIALKYGLKQDRDYATIKLSKASSAGIYTVNESLIFRNRTGYHVLIAASHNAIFRVSWEDVWELYLRATKNMENKLNGPTIETPLKMYEYVTEIDRKDLIPYWQHNAQRRIEKGEIQETSSLFDDSLQVNLDTGEVKKTLTYEDVIFQIKKSKLPFGKYYGVPRGGAIVAALMTNEKKYTIVDTPEEADYIIDDIIDSGATKKKYEKYKKPFFALYDYSKVKGPWIVFPWEKEEINKGVDDHVTRLKQFIGKSKENLTNILKEIEHGFPFGG